MMRVRIGGVSRQITRARRLDVVSRRIQRMLVDQRLNRGRVDPARGRAGSGARARSRRSSSRPVDSIGQQDGARTAVQQVIGGVGTGHMRLVVEVARQPDHGFVDDGYRRRGVGTAQVFGNGSRGVVQVPLHHRGFFGAVADAQGRRELFDGQSYSHKRILWPRRTSAMLFA